MEAKQQRQHSRLELRQQTAATESTSDDALVIKIGHAQSEDGDWHKGLEVFRDKVAELSNGTMEVQIYANETLDLKPIILLQFSKEHVKAL